MNVLVPDGDRYAFRHALLGEAVYDDLLPGRAGPAPRRLRDRAARRWCDRHRRRARPPRPAGPRPRDRAATPPSAPATTRSRSAVPTRPSTTTSRRSSWSPTRAGRGDDRRRPVRPGRPPRRRADRLGPSPHARSTLLAEELDRLPADAPDAWRARMLSARAYLLLITETEERARRARPPRPSGSSPTATTAVRARVLATHARVLTAFDRFDEAQPVGARGARPGRAAPAHRPGLRPRAHPQPGPAHRPAGRAARGAARRRSTGARRSGAVQRRAARPLPARPLLRGPSASGTEAEAAFRRAIARAERDRAALRAVRLRVPLAPRASSYVVRGSWDDALDLVAAAGSPPQVARRRCSTLFRAPDRAGARGRRRRPAAGAAPALGRRGPDRDPLRRAGDGRRGSTRRPRRRARAPTTTRSRSCRRLWHPWFTARIRLAATAIGALAELRARAVGCRPRAWLPSTGPSELHADGHVVLERHHEPGRTLGPRGPGVGAAARRRAAAAALARRGAARPRRPGRGVARGRAADRRLRRRPRARVGPGRAGHHPARRR